jgi:signal transduction histidine kinase
LAAVIREGAERLSGTIENLLALARVQTGQTATVEPLELCDLVTTAANQHRACYPDRALETTAPAPGLKVLGSRMYLKHMLANILLNAEKYTPSGKAIFVEVSKEGAEAVVRVVDQGIGLTPEDMEHIFEPCYCSPRMSQTSSGVGVGLTLCKRLAEEQGGRMWVESAGEGRGSVFGFTLPLAARS